MVLVTGPTGSGKTTTLYAALSEIKNDEDKIITIEDPVEYQLPGITQIPVNEKKGLTFARGLRSILRHDPDKIMVGEIRDDETAQIAIQSALTGPPGLHDRPRQQRRRRARPLPQHGRRAVQLRLGAQLHPGAAPGAPDLRLAASARSRPRPSSSHESGLDPARYRDFTFYEGEGCIDCNGTGYRGRTAIAELLDMSDRIREMILDKRPAADIKRAAKEEGMTFLREAALGQGVRGQDHAARDQQGDVRRMSVLDPILARVRSFDPEALLSLRPKYPPVAVEIERGRLTLVRVKQKRRQRPLLEAFRIQPAPQPEPSTAPPSSSRTWPRPRSMARQAKELFEHVRDEAGQALA